MEYISTTKLATELNISRDDLFKRFEVLGIVHAYEKKLPNTTENVYSVFHIPSGNGRPKAVYIEYWGMENDEKYNQRKNKKIEIYSQLGLCLIR